MAGRTQPDMMPFAISSRKTAPLRAGEAGQGRGRGEEAAREAGEVQQGGAEDRHSEAATKDY